MIRSVSGEAGDPVCSLISAYRVYKNTRSRKPEGFHKCDLRETRRPFFTLMKEGDQATKGTQ